MARVIGMIARIVTVVFVEALVDFQKARKVFDQGAAIALMIAALTGFSRFGSTRGAP